MLRRGFVDRRPSWVRRHRLLPHPHGDSAWLQTGQASSPACRAASTREQSASTMRIGAPRTRFRQGPPGTRLKRSEGPCAYRDFRTLTSTSSEGKESPLPSSILIQLVATPVLDPQIRWRSTDADLTKFRSLAWRPVTEQKEISVKISSVV